MKLIKVLLSVASRTVSVDVLQRRVQHRLHCAARLAIDIHALAAAHVAAARGACSPGCPRDEAAHEASAHSRMRAQHADSLRRQLKRSGVSCGASGLAKAWRISHARRIAAVVRTTPPTPRCAAASNAGYYCELACGGLSRPALFEAAVSELMRMQRPGAARSNRGSRPRRR